MATFLITGTSRGLGLALVKELASRPTDDISKVIAVVRKPSADLQAVADNASNVSIVTFEVTSEASIKEAVPQVEAALRGRGLDVLINNAGIVPYSTDGTKSMDNLEEAMQVNVLSAHWVTRNFLPLLQKGNLKKVANITSTVGSMALMPGYAFMSAPAYKISKAALNALTVNYALDFADAGFSFMAICPGWMKTNLGGEDADLTAEQGAKATLDIIFRPNRETNGQFPVVFVKGYENAPGPNVYDGKNAPW